MGLKRIEIQFSINHGDKTDGRGVDLAINAA
jgi:hypothetical protein